MEHQLALSVEGPFAVDEAGLIQTARRLLEGELRESAELSIVIMDDESVRALNREFRDYDEPTDVLSFGLTELAKPAGDDEQRFEFPVAPDGLLHLGEVVIAHPMAERQAVEHGRPLKEELRHLLIHGTLHLLGYDHAVPEEASVMRAREQALLSAGVD